jgi:hypothetical protein
MNVHVVRFGDLGVREQFTPFGHRYLIRGLGRLEITQIDKPAIMPYRRPPFTVSRNPGNAPKPAGIISA